MLNYEEGIYEDCLGRGGLTENCLVTEVLHMYIALVNNVLSCESCYM